MGSCCVCGIQEDPVDDELVQEPLKEFYSDSNSKVIQLTEQSPQEIVEEMVQMLTRSFAGTTTSAPEGTMSWVLDPKASGDDPSLPLLEDPSEDRMEFHNIMIKLILKLCLPQRSCFALIKGGKVVSAALCLPPSTKELSSANPLYLLYLTMSLGLPQAMKDKDVRDRMAACQEASKAALKKWAPSPHWDIICFASDPTEQGKGYGRQMMEFMTSLADKSGHPILLETYGPRNERFYSRNGYELKERIVLRTKHDSLEKHGGLAIMVRSPNMNGLLTAN